MSLGSIHKWKPWGWLAQWLHLRFLRNHHSMHPTFCFILSGGHYLLPPQEKDWCCLCTGILGRLDKQDMKIHSFLQYHPQCLPKRNENAHIWRKRKSKSGLSSWKKHQVSLIQCKREGKKQTMANGPLFWIFPRMPLPDSSLLLLISGVHFSDKSSCMPDPVV